MERIARCSGTPTTHAACPRLGRRGPARGRGLHLGRAAERPLVRSYPTAPGGHEPHAPEAAA